VGRAEESAALFKDGFNCAQAVLAAYGAGLDRETALRLASPLGGGLGDTGEVCGAVTGALMAIGLAHGSTSSKDLRGMVKVQGLAREFMKRFRGLHGSTQCRELLGCDIGTPEGMKEAGRRRLFSRSCPEFVRDASEILEEML
jgi:C_GCAxxG_C_C family probable redox protein